MGIVSNQRRTMKARSRVGTQEKEEGLNSGGPSIIYRLGQLEGCVCIVDDDGYKSRAALMDQKSRSGRQLRERRLANLRSY